MASGPLSEIDTLICADQIGQNGIRLLVGALDNRIDLVLEPGSITPPVEVTPAFAGN
ncbi:MAG: hypothetical protein M3Y77_22930 [Actinomycetota bacterium]|nr:hypothetical protein [Actinomycetota bacterium]